MPEMFKKHILSHYATVQAPLPDQKGPTLHTDSIELSDPDEFHLAGPTYLTHAVESSDPDEFIASGTITAAKNTEVSNLNKMNMGPTRITFTTEISDEDEFLLM